METMSYSVFRADLSATLDRVNQDHIPILITRQASKSSVVISLEDWQAINETLHLSSIPNMMESIKEGMETPIEELSEDLDW